MSNDLPKYWNEDTGEILEVETYDNVSALVPVEEVVPLPSIAEQKEIINDPELSKESKDMLSSLIEMNKVAQTLDLIHSNETAEQRKSVVTAWCEAFVSSRMKNNVVAEELKARLLSRLIDNVENLDLETTSRIYNDLHDVSSVDGQQALANVMGGGASMPNQTGGINLTINNATSEGATITNNTLNANAQQVGQLKEVAAMNTSIKAWSNVPLPKKKDS